MKIAVCDDDQSFRELLEGHLKLYFEGKHRIPYIKQFSSGEELVSDNTLYDFVFLDINMGCLNGIETGRILKSRNPHCVLFFITCCDEYLDDAFDIKAFRYLLKPIDIPRLYKSLDCAQHLFGNSIITFYDAALNSDIKAYTSDVVYVEISKRRTKVYTVNGSYLSNKSISYWKNKLNSVSFVCPHSSFIVNLDYAICHTRKELLLSYDLKAEGITVRKSVAIAPRKQSEIRRLFLAAVEMG